jgi:hypothetical protein
MGSGAGGTSFKHDGAIFYRYQDASGRVHIVDSLDLVPMAQQSRAERVQYDDWTSTGSSPYQQVINTLRPAHGLSSWQTFGLGVGAAMLLAFVFRRLPSSFNLVLRLAIVVGAVALLGGAYLGWARRNAGLPSAMLASPELLLEDAKHAVEKMNARTKQQQAELKEAEQSK